MTPQEALNILTQVVAQTSSIPANVHKMEEALAVLENAIAPKAP